MITRAGTNYYNPRYRWDIIICPFSWYFLLAHTSSYQLYLYMHNTGEVWNHHILCVPVCTNPCVIQLDQFRAITSTGDGLLLNGHLETLSMIFKWRYFNFHFIINWKTSSAKWWFFLFLPQYVEILHHLSLKSHGALLPYLTMHHFVAEMVTCMLTLKKKWCIVGYSSHALRDLWYGSNICFAFFFFFFFATHIP